MELVLLGLPLPYATPHIPSPHRCLMRHTAPPARARSACACVPLQMRGCCRPLHTPLFVTVKSPGTDGDTHLVRGGDPIP